MLVESEMAFVPTETNILVAGGGGVAMKTAQRLRDLSCNVYVLQRSSNRSDDITAMGASMVRADVLEKDQVANMFAGYVLSLLQFKLNSLSGIDRVDVVVSSIGGSPADTQPDAEGNINLIDAAMQKGVKKFILVTSIGVGNSKDATPPNVYEVLEPVLLAKEKAEIRLKVQSITRQSSP